MSWRDRKMIDVHVHVTAPSRRAEKEDALTRAAGQHFKSGAAATIDDVVDYYRERDMAAVVFAVDSEAGTGRTPVDAEEILAAASSHPDLIIPFASVDPRRGRAGLDRATRLIERGVRGFKFQPSTQGFYPNDPAYYPLYGLISEAGLPAIFHTGQTGMGAGMRGGAGIRLKYSQPMLLDDVAVDFPDLTIIMAHPSVPWQDEGLAVALHKPNVFIDLSGWSPKYFEPKLVQYAKKLIPEKFLFGSDFPLLKPDRWLDDFATLGFTPEQTQAIVHDNAARVLGGEAS